MRARAVAILPLLVTLPSVAVAATRQVGPGKAYADPCAAIAAAQPGDVVEIDPGTYASTCSWSKDNLTVRGVGGRPKLDLSGKALAEGKGILVVHAANATIEDLELTGARLAVDKNGAGIRHQGTNLTVRRCYLHDNDDGVLGAPSTDGTGDVLIESSELAKNGAGDGQSHNLYLNRYASFTLTRSYTHDAVIGHLVKSRAQKNVVTYNRITDEGGTASYELDFPNGGLTLVIGNLVQQSPTTDNPAIISFGEEGATNADQRLFVVNNTFVNDRGAGGTFVVDTTSTPAALTNNLFVGKGTVSSQASAVLTTNLTDADGDPLLVARESYDYRLRAGSPAVDRGTAPGANGADSLAPAFEYAPPLGAVARRVVGAAIDVGAYELGNAPSEVPGPSDAGATSSSGAGAPPSGAPGGSSSGAGGDADSGCGCSTPGRRAGSAAGAVLVLGLAVAARRRAARRPAH